jgi:hypothetical protein
MVVVVVVVVVVVGSKKTDKEAATRRRKTKDGTASTTIDTTGMRHDRSQMYKMTAGAAVSAGCAFFDRPTD